MLQPLKPVTKPFENMIITFDEEKKLCVALLCAKGMNKADAEILASSVAYSDFSGIYSHGLSRFSNYLNRFDNGAYTVNANIVAAKDSGPVVSFDCDNGCGVIAVSHVYEEMKTKVRQHGIVIATGRRASNLGCCAFYGRKAIDDGLIMMICCNTTRCVAPFGGADSFLGTNPIMICAPSKEERPLLLDISTSNVAFGKVQAYAREGKELPAGWALDAEGKPTTDAKAAKTVIPIAGPKGYGLAVFVDMFSAILAQAGYGDGIGISNKGQHENTGFSMILIDPNAFMPEDLFRSSVDEYIRSIKAGNKAPGVSEIFLPGELEFKRLEDNLVHGYDVSDALQSELLAFAVKCGVVQETADFDELLRAAD